MAGKKRRFLKQLFGAEKNEPLHSQATEAPVTDPGASTLTTPEATANNVQSTASLVSPAISTTSNCVAEENPTFPTEPQQLWDESYEILKNEQPSLLKGYENILARELDEGPANISTSVDQQDIIEQNDPNLRRLQMRMIAQKGLKKMAKEAKVKRIALAINEIMQVAFKLCPEAAFALLGISLGLQILLNPVKGTESSRSGLEYICNRMNWYWELSSYLIREDNFSKAHYVGLGWELKKQIVDLYKSLLLYQIMSICSYYRNRFLVFLRDTVQLDGWNGSLDDVKSKEAIVHEGFGAYFDQSSLDSQQKGANFLQEISKNVSAQALQHRDMQEEKYDNRCLRDLFLTDPATDMVKIQEEREPLISESCSWILDHPCFTTWQNSDTTRLLWIRGGPGKGKTMLMMSIINHVSQKLQDNNILSFFFCQETFKGANAPVLRGLIYQILDQNRALISHLRKVYDTQGSKLFQSSNTSTALKPIFADMISDPKLNRAYLVVDALDECQPQDRKYLLNLINESVSKWPHVKWLVSSRHSAEIEGNFQIGDHGDVIDLEKDADDFIGSGLSLYINHKLSDLFGRFGKAYAYEDPHTIAELHDLQKEIADEVQKRANGTFLWVSLVFRQINETDLEADSVIEFIRQMPSTLRGMYERMMEKIINSPNAMFEPCRQALSVAIVTYRPLQLSEMRMLAEFKPLAIPKRIILRCGLLSIRESDQTVSFVHQSAKDYLTDQESKFYSKLFPDGHLDGHRNIIIRSLTAMNRLEKDIDGLQDPSFQLPENYVPHSDLLKSARYSCVYWIDHLCEMENPSRTVDLRDEKIISFWEKHFLHWLEALSLLRSLPHGVVVLMKFISLVKGHTSGSDLHKLAWDSHRFLLSCQGVIADYPLQIYSSAILFSPELSVIRNKFKNEEPDWIVTKPVMEADWGACLQLMVGHSDQIRAVALSSDGERIVSGADDRTLRVWDSNNGVCLKELCGHEKPITSVVFSPDGRHIISASLDCTIKIWDSISGDCLHKLNRDNMQIESVALSPCGKHIISGSENHTVMIWDFATGVYLHTLYECQGIICSVNYSSDGRYIASSDRCGDITIWDVNQGVCIHRLHAGDGSLNPIALSPNSQHIAATSVDRRITIWDIASGTCLQKLDGGGSDIKSLAFTADGKHIIAGSSLGNMIICDLRSGACLDTLHSHTDTVTSIDVSATSTFIVTGSLDSTIRLWDMNKVAPVEKSNNHTDTVNSVFFSPTGEYFASASDDTNVKIWDTSSGTLIHTCNNGEPVLSVSFSSDGKLIASGTKYNFVRIWDESGTCIRTLEHGGEITSVVFSHDSRYLSSLGVSCNLRIWDVESGASLRGLGPFGPGIERIVFCPSDRYFVTLTTRKSVVIWCRRTLRSLNELLLDSYNNWDRSFAFSPDGKYIVSGSEANIVKVWDSRSSIRLHALSGHEDTVSSVAVSTTNCGGIIASGSDDKTVKIWDVVSGDCLKTLIGHVGRILLIEFLPDGKQVYSMSTDHTIRLWNVKDGTCIKTIDARPPSCLSLQRTLHDGTKYEEIAVTAFGNNAALTQGHRYRLNCDNDWIAWNGQNILRLPLGHKATSWAYNSKSLVIGFATGRIFRFGFSNYDPCQT